MTDDLTNERLAQIATDLKEGSIGECRRMAVELQRRRIEVNELRLQHKITSEGVAELRLVHKDAADWLEEYCAGLRDRGDD